MPQLFKHHFNNLLITSFLWLALTCTAHAALEFPPLTGHVVDQAHLLDTNTQQQLEQALTQYEQTTSNQVIIATVNSLQGNTDEEYGYQLGRYWGIGQKDKNNGVILLIAPNERKIRIEVGYGLEGTLTDALSQQIIANQITPAFKQKNYTAGIIQGTQAILAVLGGDTTQTAHAEHSKKLPFWVWFILIPLIFLPRRGFWGGGYYGGGFGGFGGGGFSGGGGSFGGGGSSGGW